MVDWVWAGVWYRGSTSRTYWAVSGSKRISTAQTLALNDVIFSRWQRPYWDPLASLFYSGKKRRCAVHLFLQSMVGTLPTKLLAPSGFFYNFFPITASKTEGHEYYYIYIYAFSRCFYPKRLTVHSGYTFFLSVCVCSLGIEPTTFALLTQCSNHWATRTEECKNYYIILQFFSLS